MFVDDGRRAGLGRLINQGCQIGGGRYVARHVVIGIHDLCAGSQALEQRVFVFVHADIQHGDSIARCCLHLAQEFYVAFNAGHQRGITWLRQAELKQ